MMTANDINQLLNIPLAHLSKLERFFDSNFPESEWSGLKTLSPSENLLNNALFLIISSAHLFSPESYRD